jgi:hypothetical protein
MVSVLGEVCETQCGILESASASGRGLGDADVYRLVTGVESVLRGIPSVVSVLKLAGADTAAASKAFREARGGPFGVLSEAVRAGVVVDSPGAGAVPELLAELVDILELCYSLATFSPAM